MSVSCDCLTSSFRNVSSRKWHPVDYSMWIPHIEADGDESEIVVPTGISVAKPTPQECERSKPKETKSQLETAFQKETNGASSATVDKAIIIARKLGYSPSKLDEQLLEKKYGNSVSMQNFERWLETIRHPEDTVSFLTEIFRTYDTNHTGSLTKNQIRNIITEKGDEDSLTMEEFELLAGITNMTGDVVFYNDLCKRVLA